MEGQGHWCQFCAAGYYSQRMDSFLAPQQCIAHAVTLRQARLCQDVPSFPAGSAAAGVLGG